MVRITPFFFAISVLSQFTPSHAASNGLAARQSFNPPSACQSTCQVVLTMSNCGADLSCLCADTIGSQLQQCMDCAVSASPSVEGAAQSAISDWNESCNGSLSLTTGSSSGSSSGGTSGGSSSGSTNDAAGLRTASMGMGIVAALVGAFTAL